jgi:hypothetical protein
MVVVNFAPKVVTWGDEKEVPLALKLDPIFIPPYKKQ